MNLDVYIENKFPQFRQDLKSSREYSVDYFFNDEPCRNFHLIPKTNSIEIHKSIIDYLCCIKRYEPNTCYVAKTKDIQVLAMNDVGSINVIGPHDVVFSDISTRYNFPARDVSMTHDFNGDNVLLSLDSGSNYFHWLIQILPRIALLNEFNIDWSSVNKILIPDIRGNFIMDTLKMLNIPLDKIVQQQSNHCYRFENLFIPSKPNNHIHFQYWSLDFLRNLFLPQTKKSKDKKIFISRRKKSGRYIENESKFIKLIESFGFKTFFMEELSVVDQASLFNSATHIISTHGAALANLCFCNPATKIIELFNPYHFHCLYWSLSDFLNLDYHYYVAKSSDTDGKNASLQIDLNHFKNIIEHACK